jgi:hypothetical protein
MRPIDSDLTILPSLKEGNSYRTQRAPRWVPAAGPIPAGLTLQVIRASPALGYCTNLVFQCKNLAIAPAKTVEHSASALCIPPRRTGFLRITGKVSLTKGGIFWRQMRDRHFELQRGVLQFA